MPKFDFVISSSIKRSNRVLQMEGIFELPPSQRSEIRWAGDLPLENRPWSIGMIVGPSGAGKTTLARQLFGDKIINGYDWGHENSIIDDFPSSAGIKDITGYLSQVGFSSPPSWLRPFRCLSNGEQFRVTLARAIAESSDLFVFDEFTSVVDRNVAEIGSHALQKTIRKQNRKMIAVGVHYDVIDWLQPDWIYEPHINRFQWRELRQRPIIDLHIIKCDKADWQIFKRHHYLDTNINSSAKCFIALYKGNPVAFTAVLHFPHPTASRWREHRTVCLPDYQGAGIGNAMSEFIASIFKATGKPYTSVTANPAMIYHRAKSKLWYMREKPKIMPKAGKSSSIPGIGKTIATGRMVASFDYVGPANYDAARGFELI